MPSDDSIAKYTWGKTIRDGASVGTRHAPALPAQAELRITECEACLAYDARTNMQVEQPLGILWGEVERRRATAWGVGGGVRGSRE